MHAPNHNLGAARIAREDEFYTQLGDIEKELRHYRKHFKGKVVYCNCDDPRVSNFFHFFSYNFERLGLKRLITTSYRSQAPDLFSQNDSQRAVKLEYEGDKNDNRVPDPEEIGIELLEGDGDFRSAESEQLLAEADIVVTNPPFSLFREYVTHLMSHGKKFVIVGNQNALSYQEVFPLIKADKLWLGHNAGDMAFRVPDYYEPREHRYWEDEDGQKWRSLGNACWFTNLDISKRHEDLILYETYDPERYPSYDNYDAIEVSRVASIPRDYDGVMGVPLTFLSNYNPEQFEIVGMTQSWAGGVSRIYPRQTQVGANGRESAVTKLNDGAAIKVATPPVGRTYYRVGDECFVKAYARLLIRRKGSE